MLTSRGRRWTVSAVLLVVAFATRSLWWCPHPLNVQLSVIEGMDIHEKPRTTPEATCAVVLRVENRGSSELIFATDQTARARVNNHWLEPTELLWSAREVGLRLRPGDYSALAVAVPPRTEVLRLFLRARPPALIERARWFLIDMSCGLESKVNWGWFHSHLPLVPGWRRAEYEIAVPAWLQFPDRGHNPTLQATAAPPCCWSFMGIRTSWLEATPRSAAVPEHLRSATCALQ
jgi:hypothetical protein